MITMTCIDQDSNKIREKSLRFSNGYDSICMSAITSTTQQRGLDTPSKYVEREQGLPSAETRRTPIPSSEPVARCHAQEENASCPNRSTHEIGASSKSRRAPVGTVISRTHVSRHARQHARKSRRSPKRDSDDDMYTGPAHRDRQRRYEHRNITEAQSQ